MNFIVHFPNIYGPYSNRKCFWDWLKAFGLLSLPHLILAVDLNFTWSTDEVWGSGRSLDLLWDYFSTLFDDAQLVDVSLTVISPTWSNGRCGLVGIAKRLDIFFMAESLCVLMGKY